MIKGINFEKFKMKDFLYLKNITDGFDNFSHICFYCDYNEYENFILMLINESRDSYFDFYFYEIKEDEKYTFLNTYICDNIIKEFDFEKDKLYFNTRDVTEEILKFLIKISFEEVLFSTFYFKNPDVTVWTNYNKQLILFFRDNEDFYKYKTIGENLFLKILFEKCL